MGKLDSAVINVVLDEIMRAAVDGGMGSSRCDMMAETLSSMCSMSVRGRILAKLRKVSHCMRFLMTVTDALLGTRKDIDETQQDAR